MTKDQKHIKKYHLRLTYVFLVFGSPLNVIAGSPGTLTPHARNTWKVLDNDSKI